MSCPKCRGRGEVPTEDREWVTCDMCYVRTSTRAERQVAAVRKVIDDFGNDVESMDLDSYMSLVNAVFQFIVRLRIALEKTP